MEDEYDYILSALENTTRREILRRLVLDDSYALEISRKIGISQQAINKQLEVLERANLIFSIGREQNPQGASRKIYRPTGFSTLIIDYSRNFIETKRYPLDFKDKTVSGIDDSSSNIMDSLKEVNQRLDELMEKRNSLVRQKDSLIASLTRKVSENFHDDFSEEILLNFIELLDIGAVSRKLSLPEFYVNEVVNKFMQC
ncbi:MAG: ArsR/SmtB family transcription factor [Thermoplasmataceae archaeon]